MKLFGFNVNKSKPNEIKVDREVILSAYNRRRDEIESLRKYDRGEKAITVFSLSSLNKNI